MDSIKVPKSKKIDPELQNLSDRYHQVKVNLLERGLSTFYVKNCYESYRTNHVSAGRLAEMLLCNEVELDDLLGLFNLKLFHEH